MLPPADAVPRETRRRTTRRRDRKRKKEIESGGGGKGDTRGRPRAGWQREGREVRYRRSEEVEWGKSSARSTIFPSRRAVTFYLASFGECSDWSVGKEISFFLRGEGNAVAPRPHTPHFLCGYFSQPPSKRCIFNQLLCKINNLKVRENLCHSFKD